MLMKHTQVSRTGVVTDPPLAQLTYGALLSGRVGMVADSANTAKKVSGRYLCQGKREICFSFALETDCIVTPYTGFDRCG